MVVSKDKIQILLEDKIIEQVHQGIIVSEIGSQDVELKNRRTNIFTYL